MNILIVLTFLTVLLTWKVAGVCSVAVTAFVAWLLFAARKVGYFCKLGRLLMVEGVGLFLLALFQLMTKNVDIKLWMLLILARGSSILLMRYDIKNFVYVTEERKREDS